MDFLNAVASGRHFEVEDLIKKDPNLLLSSGNILLPDGKEFNGVTALQIALYQLDYRTWRIILRHLDEKASFAQISEMENLESFKRYGMHADWQPVIDSLVNYVKNYETFSSVTKSKEYCESVVCKLQKDVLPAHVLQEYFLLVNNFFNESFWISKFSANQHASIDKEDKCTLNTDPTSEDCPQMLLDILLTDSKLLLQLYTLRKLQHVEAISAIKRNTRRFLKAGGTCELIMVKETCQQLLQPENAELIEDEEDLRTPIDHVI